jgi:hypothetical protein
MPGEVSDSYDPEFGTGANAAEVREALARMYDLMTWALDGKPPLPILEVVRGEFPDVVALDLTERDRRLLRFALERALESV